MARLIRRCWNCYVCDQRLARKLWPTQQVRALLRSARALAVSKIVLAVSKIRIDQADSVAWTSAPSDIGAYTVQGITEITLERRLQ